MSDHIIWEKPSKPIKPEKYNDMPKRSKVIRVCLTGEPKAFTGNQPRRWRVERCHGCNRLVYACRSELDKNGKHYHRECAPKPGMPIYIPG